MLPSPYSIRVFGDPVLKTACDPVGAVDANIKQLAKDMLATMYAAPGVGLAGNQIGVRKRIFVYDDGSGAGAKTMINPVITETSGQFTWEEGCLSVPGLFFPIVRPNVVHIEGTDLDGNAVQFVANEFLGRILQHEVDHLNGLLMLDRLDPDQRKAAMPQLREMMMKSEH